VTNVESRRIRLKVGDLELSGVLNATATADKLWSELPIDASGNTWGDEIYFRTSIEAEEEDAREVVDLGDIGYWPPGQALCLFYGPTPASRGDEIRPASAVNIIGKMDGDATVLKGVSSGVRVVIEKA
jgi:hypothetical protein